MTSFHVCCIIDDYAVIWINGTKSIMTAYYSMTTDPRVKSGTQSETSAEYQEHTLIIEQVTRMDSGFYTCRITTTPPLEITHTLRVTRQYLSVYFITLSVLLRAPVWRRLRCRYDISLVFNFGVNLN